MMKSLQWNAPHTLFLACGLIFGLLFVFNNPPWHTNDEDRHFYNAYNLSKGHLGPQAQNNQCGFMVPQTLVTTINNFQGIPFGEKMKLKPDLISSLADEPMNTDSLVFHVIPSTKLPPFAYLPSALMIKVGGWFTESAVWLGWWGRIGSLIAYLLITSLAVYNIPRYKSLLILLALSPMALYQGASVTYDSMSFALLFLLLSLFLKYYFGDNPIGWREVLLLVLVAMLHRFSKEGYYPLYFCVLFLPLSRFENKAAYWAMIPLMLCAAFVPKILWNTYLQGQHLPAELPLQKDYVFDLSRNLQHHMLNPLQLINLLFLNILNQGKMWLAGAVGRLGYSYTLIPSWILISQYAMMIGSVMMESHNTPVSRKLRLGMIALSVINIMAIILMLFLSGTPIGGHYLHGMQGRYFTPIIAFLFPFLFYLPKPIRKSNGFMWISFGYIIIALGATLQFMNSFFYSTP